MSQEADWNEDLGEPGVTPSFGLDADGEILITTSEGLLGRIVPTL